jgi:hypothetical protein
MGKENKQIFAIKTNQIATRNLQCDSDMARMMLGKNQN